MTKRSAILSLSPTEQDDRSDARSMAQVVLAYGVYEFINVCAVGAMATFGYAYFALSWVPLLHDILLSPIIVAIGIVSGSVVRNHYDGYGSRSRTSVIWSGLIASLRGFALLLTFLFLMKNSESISRGALIVQFLAVTGMVMLSRSLFYVWLRTQIAAGRIVNRRVLIVGDSARIVETITTGKFRERLRDSGDTIVRMMSWQGEAAPEADKTFVTQTVAECRKSAIDCVVILPSALRMDLAGDLLDSLSETPVAVHLIPHAAVPYAAASDTGIGGQASMLVLYSPLDKLGKIAKRALDISVAGLMLFLLGPLFIGVALVIKLDSPGPVFFRQTRHGYGNRLIRVFKFRSMRVMEDGAAFRQATKNDARITSVGRVIRRTNLDELPQLLNVLLGDMSLVGPRPHPVALNEDFAERIRLFHRRHNILPGITGWAQVNGLRGETDTEDKMVRRVEHDIWYIDNWSIGLDLRILILTVFSSVAYRNAG